MSSALLNFLPTASACQPEPETIKLRIHKSHYLSSHQTPRPLLLIKSRAQYSTQAAQSGNTSSTMNLEKVLQHHFVDAGPGLTEAADV